MSWLSKVVHKVEKATGRSVTSLIGDPLDIQGFASGKRALNIRNLADPMSVGMAAPSKTLRVAGTLAAIIASMGAASSLAGGAGGGAAEGGAAAGAGEAGAAGAAAEGTGAGVAGGADAVGAGASVTEGAGMSMSEKLGLTLAATNAVQSKKSADEANANAAAMRDQLAAEANKPVPVLPDPDASAAARRRSLVEQFARRGRRSTILTSDSLG